MKKTLFLLAGTLILGSVAQARPDRNYGSAGCGLGNMIFHKRDNQILAATFNGTSGNQTFGITSGTSNCTDHDSRSHQAAAFIELNREKLANDVARGEGESLETLAQLMNVQDTGAFGRRLQAHYSEIFSNTASNAAVQAQIEQYL